MQNCRIEINNLKAYVNIGITEEERSRKQRISITAEIIPKNYPPENDSIDEVVNYSNIREDILDICRNSSFNLIESLAKSIANNIKNKYNVDRVTVKIMKFPYSDVNYVSFDITV